MRGNIMLSGFTTVVNSVMNNNTITGVFDENFWAAAWVDYGAVTGLFILVFALVAINFCVRWVLAKLGAQVLKTHTFWDDAVFAAARKPLSFFIWVIGLSFIGQVLHNQTEAFIFSYVAEWRRLLVLVLLLWFVVAFIKEVEKGMIAEDIHQSQFDQTTIHAMAKLLRTAVIITGVLLVLQALGYNISSVLAFGSIGGLAVSFAAKDLLANFFGGLMVYMDRPFSVGDWIRSPDRNIEGTVEKIGWRTTCIRTFDKRPLYVPNSTFTNIAVENPSRMSNRRIYETIGLRYVDVNELDTIVAEVKSMLLSHPEIDASQTLIVNFNKFADSSLEFFVYTFTKTTEWVKFHEIKHEVLMKVGDIIRQHGAEMAFPTQTVELQQKTKD